MTTKADVEEVCAAVRERMRSDRAALEVATKALEEIRAVSAVCAGSDHRACIAANALATVRSMAGEKGGA